MHFIEAYFLLKYLVRHTESYGYQVQGPAMTLNHLGLIHQVWDYIIWGYKVKFNSWNIPLHKNTGLNPVVGLDFSKPAPSVTEWCVNIDVNPTDLMGLL